MAHTLAMRATSLVASAGILGVLLLVAMSATYVVQNWPAIDPPTEISITDPPVPPEPPPPRPVEDTRPIETPTLPFEIAALPTDPTAPPTATHIAVSTPPPGPLSITNPRWLERPTNLTRYYPRRAIERGVTGFVLLDCMVATSGLLNCRVLSETPSGWGFSDAALRIAADHRMAPAMRDGVAVEGRYRMRVPFNLNQ
jgi:protein TonB